MAFSATILDTELNAAFTTAIATNTKAGKKDFCRHVFVPSIDGSTVLSARTYAFTPHTDEEIRTIFLRGYHTTPVPTDMSATLTVDNGDDRYLIEQPITLQTSPSAPPSTADSRTSSSTLDLRTVTGTRLFLLAGVRYRMTITSVTTTWTSAMFVLQTRTRRRRS